MFSKDINGDKNPSMSPSFKKKYFIASFYILSGAIVLINLYWFISGSPPLKVESPLRIIIGSLLIFFMPGLIWGEILGFKSQHILQTLAVSFVLTMAIDVICIPLPFFLRSSIKLWVALLFLSTAAGIVLLLLKARKGREFEFIRPFQQLFIMPVMFNISAILMLAIIIVISFGSYRWGEDITAIFGEKLLHIHFVRFYYSMPLIHHDIGVSPGMPPPNLVQLWEYLLAGWASLINIDPLLLFYRASFIIPILGLSGMYLLSWSIFRESKKAEAIFWGVLIMCFGGFISLSPSPYDWIKTEQFRDVFSFTGTVHHTDSATILIAMGAACIFLMLKEPTWRNGLLFAAIAATSFLWHTKEFFQSALYAGMLGLTILLSPGENKKTELKKWAVIMSILLISAAVFFIMMKLLILPLSSNPYQEFKLKELALKYALLPENLLGIRNLFHFPQVFFLSRFPDPNFILGSAELRHLFDVPLTDSLWLILTAASLAVIAVMGDKESRRLAVFFILVWALILAWNSGMLITIALTYSEFLFINIRLLYVFAYLIIADALYLISQWFYNNREKSRRSSLYFSAMFVAGLICSIWWHNDHPFSNFITIFLSIVVVISLVVILFQAKKTAFLADAKPPALTAAVAGMMLFFSPVLAKNYLRTTIDILAFSRDPIPWFTKSPFGFSGQLIEFLDELPPKNNVAVDVNGKSGIFLYAPQYTAVLPQIINNVLYIYEEQKSAAYGLNPLFNPSVRNGIRQPLLNELVQHKPSFEDYSLNWVPDVIETRHLPKWQDLPKVAPHISPLHISDGSKFIVQHIPGRSSSVIRILHDGPLRRPYTAIRIGYVFQIPKFEQEQEKDTYASLLVSARASGEHSRQAYIFVEDLIPSGLNTPVDADTASVRVSGPEWKGYIITKKIRNKSYEISLGIMWFPASGSEWVEIRHPRIFRYETGAATARYTIPKDISEVVNHNAVIDWLNRYNASHILVEKEYYKTLAGYFEKYPDQYRTIFNNPENKEMIVQYLRKTNR